MHFLGQEKKWEEERLNPKKLFIGRISNLPSRSKTMVFEQNITCYYIRNDNRCFQLEIQHNMFYIIILCECNLLNQFL